MEPRFVPAIFEAGKLRPLAPLDLNEHERVEVAILRIASTDEALEENYGPNIAADADSTVTLEQVQKALAKIPGSLGDDFSRERDERI